MEARLKMTVLIAGFLALSALSVAAQRSAQNEKTWVLRFDGIGPVKIGMSLGDLKATLHDGMKVEESDSDECFYVTPKAHPQIGFMIVDKRLACIDVSEAGIATAEGIQVGDSEAKAKTAYPNLEVQPHAYTAPDGSYLTVHSPDGKVGLRFETYKGKITGFYSGTAETIQYIEGCD